jgi:putative PIN family toxin of toxin-antitoxin system
MTSELRTVIDTNVLVSAALLPPSVPRQIVDLAMQHGVVLLSEASFKELDEIIRRPKFDKYVSQQRRLEFLVSLVVSAEVVPVSVTIYDCRDPKDNKFLELAISGQASHIVSGDTDLLVLHPFRGIAVMTPNAFLNDQKTQPR